MDMFVVMSLKAVSRNEISQAATVGQVVGDNKQGMGDMKTLRAPCLDG